MKKYLLRILPACIAVAFFALVSCSGNESGSPKTADKKKTAKTESTAGLPNYRYVDLDTILSRYNLAKDYNEEMLRMQNNMESALKRHETNIQGLASTIQRKMQNNGYLSEASYKQDQEKIASMQNNAQRDAANLQNNFQNAALKAQQTVNDSIEAFIKEYNAKRGYDAIFFKAATLYINPELDITDEVVEGLNARYNKMKK